MSRTQTERAKQAKAGSGDAPEVAKPGSSQPEAEVGVRASGNPQERWAMIARLAYFRAEQRGFAAGGELQDWLEAEAEVDAARVGLGNSPKAV